jgi:hypothetical protein
MLTFFATKLWLIAFPIWAMIAYILYSLFTDRPDSNKDDTPKP